MTKPIGRRQLLANGVASFGAVTFGQGTAIQSVSAQEAGTLLAARILRDCWTIEIDLAGLSPGRFDPARVGLLVIPPSAGFSRRLNGGNRSPESKWDGDQHQPLVG